MSAGGALTDVAGVGVGHSAAGGTGVTVVLLPPATVASAEVRGGAPATRELALLDPVRTVEHADAVVLCGGSAFGLAAVDGVVRHLATAGRGYRTPAGPVPIVPAAAIFDLVSSGGVHPGPDEGRAAATAATASAARAAGAGPTGAGIPGSGGSVAGGAGAGDVGGGAVPGSGRIGAGTGATVGGWRGRGYSVPGGLGQASTTVDGAAVAALAVVNAVGDVIAADGSVLAGSTAPSGAPAFPGFPLGGPDGARTSDGPGGSGGAVDPDAPEGPGDGFLENTTLVVVVTDGRLDKRGCHLVAQSAHHGLSSALRPSHTRFDGDVCFAAATGVRPVSLDRLRIAAVDVVTAAVRAAVTPQRPR